MIHEIEQFETPTSVETLVGAAQRGDRQAMGELIERYQGSIYALALRRLHNHAEAQELCQEVFVKAMLKLHQLQVPAAFGSWLRSITNRLAINRAVRRAPVLSAEPEMLEATCADSDSPLDGALAAERREEVRAGLRRLNELDRRTLTAFYVQGQSIVEMSDEFQSPVGTIKRRLHVARKRLAKELETLAV